MEKIEDLMTKSLNKAFQEINPSDAKGMIEKSKTLASLKREIPEEKDGETTEATGTSSAGAYVGPLFGPIRKSNLKKKKQIKGGDVTNETKKVEATEATTSSSVGVYDAPFGGPKKDPLKLSNPKTVYKELRSVKDKNFPKYGGPGGKYVRIKDKCKKFPYCNQGDIGALEFFEQSGIKEAIENIALNTQLPMNMIKSILLHELEERTLSEQDEIITITVDGNTNNEENFEDKTNKIKDKKLKFLVKTFLNKTFEFKHRDISGKIKIIDIGPESKIKESSYETIAYTTDSDVFKGNNYVSIKYELIDLKYKGDDVPISFFKHISRYLPQSDEEGYRGDPVTYAILLGTEKIQEINKYTGLHFSDAYMIHY